MIGFLAAYRRPAAHVRAVCVLCAIFVVAAQTQSVPVRWWMSPSIVRAVGVSATQIAHIEGQYERNIRAHEEASEAVIRLTESVREHLRNGYFDEMRTLTEQLAAARRTQCELRRRALEASSEALTAAQRERLRRLIVAGQLLD